MKIDVSALAADTFHFARPAVGGGGGEVSVSRIVRLAGTFHSDETGSSLQDTQAASLQVDRAVWHFASGHVEASSPARLGQIELGLSIPKGSAATSLRLAVGEANLERIAYEARALSVGGSGALQGVLIERDPDGRLAIAGVRLSIRDLRVVSGALTVTAKEVDVEAASIVIAGGELRIKAGRAGASGVSIEQGDLHVTIDRIDATEGVTFQSGDIAIGDLLVAGLAVTFARLGAKPDEVRAAPPPAPAAAKRIPNLTILDGLDGQIDLDLTVDATIPLLKSRRATHYFRIPVQRGAINFRGLERDLSLLEDAVLDFAVKNGELILEKDIPFIPFDNTTLVSWPLLDASDRDLAERKMVRLRRLIDYRLPPPKKKKAEPSAVALRELDFGNIDAKLRLSTNGELQLGGWTLSLGHRDTSAIESLSIKGALRYLAQGAPQPGHLDLRGRGFVLGIAGLPIGERKLSCRSVVIGEAESVRIDFAALKPTRLSGKIIQARLQDLRFVRSRLSA